MIEDPGVDHRHVTIPVGDHRPVPRAATVEAWSSTGRSFEREKRGPAHSHGHRVSEQIVTHTSHTHTRTHAPVSDGPRAIPASCHRASEGPSDTKWSHVWLYGMAVKAQERARVRD